MKYLQDAYVKGFVTISVTGTYPERFFQSCIDENIIVWNVKKTSATCCQANIKMADIPTVKRLRRNTGYKIKFKSRNGLPFFIKRMKKRKEIILSLVCSFLFIVCLSNILWQVNITGVSKEVEEKIREQLKEDGVHPGSWSFALQSPGSIQQKLMNDLPELLWVGVYKKGTRFNLEGIEKTIVEKEERQGPRHLLAAKKGIIKSMFVTKGLSKVEVNDYVEPGDMLVSGFLDDEDDENNEDDEEKDHPKKMVAAEAEIIAQTWYEINVSIPLRTESERLTGEQKKKHYLKFGSISIPIWGFGSPSYEDVHEETNENAVYFLKWKLPLYKGETILSEKVYNKRERTKEEAVEEGIKQAKHDLRLQLGPEATIISEKVLHEAIENGKVNVRLYVTVQEDIVKIESLSQGD